MLTTLDRVAVGGIFQQRWWRAGECRCLLQREPGYVVKGTGDSEEYVPYVLVEGCPMCSPPAETRPNGGWNLAGKGDMPVEFDPLAHALKDLDAVH